MRAKNKLLYGIGVNDANYQITQYGIVDGIKKQTWICPFYQTWKGTFHRCYAEEYLAKKPSYLGCSVESSWHHFMDFKPWMETQDWEGKQLDKDLLFPGNKIYSPEKCCFIEGKVNSFIAENGKGKGPWPVGVSFHKQKRRYIATCRIDGKNKFLGLFLTPEEAHLKWLSVKLQLAKKLALDISDKRVAEALVYRYENYLELFPS